MGKFLAALGLLLIVKLAAAGGAYPCLLITNHSPQILTIMHDPNFDDQLLEIDQQIVHNLNLHLSYLKGAQICGLWYQFGLNFYVAERFSAIEVSNLDAALTWMAIYPPNSISYATVKQDSQQLVIDFFGLN